MSITIEAIQSTRGDMMRSSPSHSGRPREYGAWRERRNHVVPLLGGGVFVIAVIVLSIGLTIHQGRTDAHRIAEVTADNLSNTLADNINGAIDKVDLGMLTVLDEVSRQQKLGRWDDWEINAAIARMDARYPDSLGFRIVGPDGRLRNGVNNVVSRVSDISQRDDFIRLRDNADGGLQITPPLFGAVAQQWLIATARRITNPDGSFGGAVYGTIPINTLTRAFAAVNIGANGAILLTHADFKIAAWYPLPKGTKNPIGTEGISDKLRVIIGSGAQAAQYDATSPVDGVRRAVSVRKIGHQPYYILVAISESDYLADWRRDSTRLRLFGALMVGMVGMAMLLIHRRIVDWRHAMTALSASEGRFRMLVDNIPQKVFLKDANSVYVTCNSAYARDLGIDQGSIAGRSDLDFFPRELAEKYQKDDAAVMESRMARDIEETYFQNGKEFFVETVKVPIQDDQGTVIGVLGIFWDISERKQAETAMREKTELLTQSNADLEQFAYVASHDLQTPLRNIVSYTQLLMRRYSGKFDADADDFIGFIVDNAKHMTRVISDLLEYSRISSQSQPLCPTPAGWAADQALTNLRADVAEAGAEVTIGDLPTVMAEPSRLVSLFQNLLGNGLKYRSPDRNVRLLMTAEHTEGGFWRFAVEDNGIGIDPAYHDKIFEIFQRLDPASQAEGTGIGLTLCRRIVHRFGGDIWVESVPGKGSTFFFTLRDGTDAA